MRRSARIADHACKHALEVGRRERRDQLHRVGVAAGAGVVLRVDENRWPAALRALLQQ
jgi:hypothetical protein